MTTFLPIWGDLDAESRRKLAVRFEVREDVLESNLVENGRALAILGDALLAYAMLEVLVARQVPWGQLAGHRQSITKHGALADYLETVIGVRVPKAFNEQSAAELVKAALQVGAAESDEGDPLLTARKFATALYDASRGLPANAAPPPPRTAPTTSPFAQPASAGGGAYRFHGLGVEGPPGSHRHAAVDVSFSARNGGDVVVPRFFPCCAARAGTDDSSRDPCKASKAAVGAEWKPHRGDIRQQRKSKSAAQKGALPAIWGCCNAVLVDVEPAPLLFKIYAECEGSGCTA